MLVAAKLVEFVSSVEYCWDGGRGTGGLSRLEPFLAVEVQFDSVQECTQYKCACMTALRTLARGSLLCDHLERQLRLTSIGHCEVAKNRYKYVKHRHARPTGAGDGGAR